MKFDQIVNDIKNLKIQSAENVAKNSILALQDHSLNIESITKTKFLDELEKAKQILFKSRPTEPCMRNALNFILHDLDASSLEKTKEKLNQRINQALAHIETAKDIIAEIGSRKLKNNSKIFTHCHSTFVMAILKKAKAQGKNFEVHNTETRPRFQGRITASELLKAGIPVVHYIDSAARLAIKKTDLMLLGCDAIDSECKIYNKIGSEMFAEIANKQDIPVYIATDSWKFDPKSVFGFNEEIEKREPQEVWPNAPKKLIIENYAFEKVDPELISGVISEIGIFKPEIFIEELRSKYRFMFV
jgi:ribose 1,5-bisphosphate isomerase